MKIEKIIIENMTSIEKAEISFSDGILANEPLFLIAGETGSGKSTILDAITLALYDKSPRYENTKNKEKTENGITTMQSTTNILRKGTNDGKAEVWFSVGNEMYIATWQMHKTRNGKYDVTNRRKLEVVKGEERIVVDTKIDVVNQKVTELVGLTYDQFVRSVMLAQGQFNTFLTSEKSKQTEILEMLTGTEVYSKIAEIVGRRKNDAKNDVEKATEFYNSLNKNILSDEEIVSLNAEIAEKECLQSKNDKDIKSVETKIANFDKLENINREIESSRSELADYQASYDKIIEEKGALQTQRDALKKQIDEQAGMKSLAEKMPLIVSVLENSKRPEMVENIDKSEFSEISNALLEAEIAQKNASEAFNECEERLKIADYEGLNAKLHEHNDELAKHEARKTKCQRVIRILAEYNEKKKLIEDKLVELSNLKQYFEACKRAFDEAEQAYKVKDAEFQIQKNMVAEHIKSLRSKLKDGEPCPLCGSTTHQYHDEGLVSTLFASIEKSYNEARKVFEEKKDEKNKTEQKIKLLEESIGNEQKLLNNLVQNLTKECNGEPVYDIERLNKGLATCDLKISEENAEIAAIKEKIKAALVVQEELKELKKKKDEADARYNTLLRNLAYHWKKLNDEYSQIDENIRKIDEIASGIKKIVGFKRIDEFLGKVATRNNIAKEEILIGFTRVLTDLVNKSKEKEGVEKALAELQDGVTKSEAKEKLAILEVQKKDLNESVSTLKAKLSLNAQNASQAEAAREDLQAKSGVLALWTELATAIGTTSTENFRDVAQAYTMRILLDQANYFLRKLSSRYELTCYTNSLAIMVVDKEMGGELRTASSLSGGETFLVSLALALGLASLNDENLNIDMLFIDEGFGTLDGESLEMAVQTLGNMQKFGRKVGIISHVESLKERIPAQILVTKRGKAASTVEIKKAS